MPLVGGNIGRVHVCIFEGGREVGAWGGFKQIGGRGGRAFAVLLEVARHWKTGIVTSATSAGVSGASPANRGYLTFGESRWDSA